MSRPDRADAIVVGAGPAGSAAAYHLAREGYRVVLLDKRRFPRDKSCGDGITRPGVALLEEMGVLGSLADAQRYDGLRVHVTDRGSREYRSADPDSERQPQRGLVVPRLRLDELLVRAAAESGAELREECTAVDLLHDDGRVSGVRLTNGTRKGRLSARFVVCADGATSRLARRAGLVTTPRDAIGYAIRGYYEGIPDLPGMLEFYLPISDMAGGAMLPSYGWVFPVGGGAANIGIGLSFRAHDANVRRLQEYFVARLRDTEPRFAEMAPCGDWRGAPLRSDFSPDHCAAPGLFAIGDAAGLVSPFTGEGISYALETGKLVSEAIHRQLALGEPEHDAVSSFSRTLARRYGGYFDTGREAAQRYELAFRIVASTFDDDRPLFELSRRAAIMPEGAGGLRTSDLFDDIADLVEPLVADLRADLAAVDEVLVRSMQREWPFLSRFAVSVERDQAVPPRAATLLLLSGYVGRPDPRDLVAMAAAVELSFFATLASAGLDPDAAAGPSSTDPVGLHWGNVFAVLTGNLELAKALELAAPLGTEALVRVTRWATQLCEGRAHELERIADPTLTPAEYVEIVRRTTGLVFESICDLGAWLGGLDKRASGALRAYGRELGIAYHLAEEFVNVSGKPTPMGPAAAADLSRGRLNLPVTVALRGRGALARGLRALASDPDVHRESFDVALEEVARSPAMEEALKTIRRHAAGAAAATEDLPEGAARDALREVARYPVTRATAALPSRAVAVHENGDAGIAWTLPEQVGVASEVRRLNELLARWRRHAEPEIAELLEYQLSGTAKYFRPVTIFACQRAAQDPRPFDRALSSAAAVELFHNYTLIVDDIVDRDRYRRGKLALHHRYGRTPSLATGAYLAFGATDLIADDAHACRVFDQLGKRIVVAECRQWRLRRHALGLDVWRTIAQEDTGVMFEACARVATADGSLARFGHLLGTLYHGCDDVADVRGAAALGGGRERDISDRILTLPAALAVRDAETADLFEHGGPDSNDELAARFAAAIPAAEAVLDEIASEVEAEARRSARDPELLLPLVRYTRALSNA